MAGHSCLASQRSFSTGSYRSVYPFRLDLKKYIFVITALPDLSTFQAHSSQGSIFEYFFKINFTYHSSSILSYRAIALFDFQLQWLKTECK